MKKMQALTAFLVETLNIPREHLSVWADRIRKTPVSKDLGHGVEIARLRYDMVFQVERLPESDSHDFLALVMAWLCDHDAEREDQALVDPEVTVLLNDEDTADVDLSVEFDEGLQIVPDENGTIPYQGKKWRVADVPIDVATKVAGVKGGSNASD